MHAVRDGLANGDNFLLYPAGRLWRRNRESLGGASAVHSLLQDRPNVPVILVRTRGLWGSSFSWAYEGRRPDIFAKLARGAWVLALNLVFFVPTRRVVVDIAEAPATFPRDAERATINAWLDSWFNQPGPDQLTVVPYNRWTGTVPDVHGGVEETAPPVDDVPDDIRRAVRDELARMRDTSPDDVTPDKDLRRDLGLDSLEMAQVLDYLARQFGAVDVALSDCTTVGHVMRCAAGGIRGEDESEDPPPVDSRWERGKMCRHNASRLRCG